MSNTPLARWLQYLETLHPDPMDLGLARVGAVARAMGLLPVTVPVVTVAGTNGKGTTVAVLESLLTECGRRPGSFTSPHLLRFNERIRLARGEVDDASIIAAFEAIDAARGETTLTYFEFALLAALWVFRELGADVIVLEVGLGGRLDAANIVDADVAVITSIDLDHQQWLGHTRELIAVEKAGILRPGKTAIIADPQPPASLLAAVERIGAEPVYQLGADFGCADSHAATAFELMPCAGGAPVLLRAAVGALLPANVAAAAQAALALGADFDDAALARAIAAAPLRGRRERLQLGGYDFLLDVAHNPAAVARLVEKLDAGHCDGRRIAIFSAMHDKAVGEMLSLCAGRFDYWLFPDQPDNPRAMPAREAASLLGQGQGEHELCADLPAAAARCLELLTPRDQAVVFGSFYTLAGVLPALERDLGDMARDE
ncbi:bifunctional tetrahydrofolate synthase/dihydrofolate synthase [Mangrovimicrobium sediminis]|uniref:Dihydrofolate synthase/folylpolyglutamate synthase n=1 Tax=Mangrovimicrobium sediminis TaxID=2562682 RepID=A0A4Z0LVY9_9GAMM|nr:Mur ligase family protein [Haliea sp. SAOS-164]TGD71394.1 bifunctional tetrahydrofolate synthase/dihydrofolate synthase [Haliea sp. SAOS-164]